MREPERQLTTGSTRNSTVQVTAHDGSMMHDGPYKIQLDSLGLVQPLVKFGRRRKQMAVCISRDPRLRVGQTAQTVPPGPLASSIVPSSSPVPSRHRGVIGAVSTYYYMNLAIGTNSSEHE
jgi:hypothetical protein